MLSYLNADDLTVFPDVNCITDICISNHATRTELIMEFTRISKFRLNDMTAVWLWLIATVGYKCHGYASFFELLLTSC